MRSMKKFGTVVAAASMLMAIGAGSASAANWDPANTTLTAHGTLTLTSRPSGSTVTCTYHSGVRSAGGTDAFTTETSGTTPAAPTFSNCTTTVPFASVTSVVGLSAWTITATSTTAVDVTGNARITLSALGLSCTITATDVSIGATWNNTSTTIVPSDTLFPIDLTGSVCPSDTQGTMTGTVTVPGASIT
jgi:hypothetical protein